MYWGEEQGRACKASSCSQRRSCNRPPSLPQHLTPPCLPVSQSERGCRPWIMSNNLIYVLFGVHAPFTVTVIYRLCSLEASLAGGEGCSSEEGEFIRPHPVPYSEAYFTHFLTLSSSVWYEIDAPLEEMHIDRCLFNHAVTSLLLFVKWLKLSDLSLFFISFSEYSMTQHL